MARGMVIHRGFLVVAGYPQANSCCLIARERGGIVDA